MKLSVRVSPRSSRNDIKKLPDGTYKIFLTAAPVDGKANESLIKIISNYFSIPKKNISVLKGKTSRNKIIEIKD